jgi:hypothetical protein
MKLSESYDYIHKEDGKAIFDNRSAKCISKGVVDLALRVKQCG